MLVSADTQQYVSWSVLVYAVNPFRAEVFQEYYPFYSTMHSFINKY